MLFCTEIFIGNCTGISFNGIFAGTVDPTSTPFETFTEIDFGSVVRNRLDEVALVGRAALLLFSLNVTLIFTLQLPCSVQNHCNKITIFCSSTRTQSSSPHLVAELLTICGTFTLLNSLKVVYFNLFTTFGFKVIGSPIRIGNGF